jgi:tetratricopeptide (TPR) repeat protein
LVKKIEILKDVIETYNRALEISKKNNLADSQQLLEEKIKWSENLIQWMEDKRMLPSLSTSDILQSSLVTLLSVKTDPERLETLFSKGYAFSKLGEHEKSMEYTKKIMRIEPQNKCTWYHKGNSLYLLGRYNEAVKCFNESLKIDPWYVNAWNMKGQCLAKLRKRPAAFACNQQALSLANKSALSESDPEVVASIWDNRGYDLSEVKDYKKAIQCFDKALNLYPSYLPAWQNKVYATLNLTIQGQTAGRSDFIGLGKLVKDALDKIGQQNKNKFLSEVRKSSIHSFKKGIFEGFINSKKMLNLLLDDFEKNLGGLVETPSLDEIEEACRKDKKKFPENRDNVNRLFS